jgi:hypothetical protein
MFSACSKRLLCDDFKPSRCSCGTNEASPVLFIPWPPAQARQAHLPS